MPIIQSAKKKLRADKRKNEINKRVKDAIKIALKQFVAKPSNENLGLAFSALDTAAKKKVLPKGRVDRKKSRLSSLVKSTPKKVPNPKRTRAAKKV